MSRFYERYGFLIAWLLTLVLGIALLYWLFVALAKQGGTLPSSVNVYVLNVHEFVLSLVEGLVRFLEKRIQWIGALATLGTFVFGLVTGIRQARRQLPRRLVQFMHEQLIPVYNNSEALVAAVAYRSANVPHKSPLYLKAPLEYALDALGGEWRPRWPRSLDESIREADTYIQVTEKRLKYLKDIRSHAQILRGANQSLECIMRPCDQAELVNIDRCAETDFTAAIENETTRLAALELRGLLRARLGNLHGALQDFEALHDQANQEFSRLGAARALRLQSEILIRQAEGTNSHLLRQARRRLNNGNEFFKDGRTPSDAEWLERARNRETYGIVQTAMAAITESSLQQAMRVLNEAIGYYRKSDLSTAADLERVAKRIEELRARGGL